MAWTNIFDAGPCRVVIAHFQGGVIDPADYASLGIAVDVSADGTVTVTASDEWPLAQVLVVPDFDHGSPSVRIVDMASSDAPQKVFSAAGLHEPDGTPGWSFRPTVFLTTDPYAPDPVEFLSPDPWGSAGVQFGGGG